RRRNALQKKRDALKGGEELPPEELRELESLDFQLLLGRFEANLRLYEQKAWERQPNLALAAYMQLRLFQNIRRGFEALLEPAFRERSGRVQQVGPDLPSLCVDGVDLLSAGDDEAMAAVTRAALTNRLDLMNQRAELVDSWRKIAVTANA